MVPPNVEKTKRIATKTKAKEKTTEADLSTFLATYSIKGFL